MFAACLLIVEFFSCPLIYFKVMWNIIKVLSGRKKLMILLVWSIFGVVFLLYYVSKDLIGFFVLLMDF